MFLSDSHTFRFGWTLHGPMWRCTGRLPRIGLLSLITTRSFPPAEVTVAVPETCEAPCGFSFTTTAVVALLSALLATATATTDAHSNAVVLVIVVHFALMRFLPIR